MITKFMNKPWALVSAAKTSVVSAAKASASSGAKTSALSAPRHLHWSHLHPLACWCCRYLGCRHNRWLGCRHHTMLPVLQNQRRSCKIINNSATPNGLTTTVMVFLVTPAMALQHQWCCCNICIVSSQGISIQDFCIILVGINFRKHSWGKSLVVETQVSTIVETQANAIS